MNITTDIIKYLENIKDVLDRVKNILVDTPQQQTHVIVEALSVINFHLSELILIKNYLVDSSNLSIEEIVNNKKIVKQIDEIFSIFKLFNSSLTAILRSITLNEKYKLEISNLKVLLENDFGILYQDEIQDYPLILHKRSGVLEKINKPYLTRKENKALAEKLFTKLKNIENTN